MGSATFGWPFAIAGAAVALLLPVVALLALGSGGVAARAPQLAEGTPPASIVASSGPAAVLLMEQEGVRGAHLVQASRDFGYRVTALEAVLSADAAEQTGVVPVSQLLRDNMDSENYLYVASHLGLVRRITHLMSAKSFEARVAEGRAQGMPGISEDGQSVVINQDGDLREIHSTLPATTGDVVLLVNASYFIDGTIADLVSSFESTDANVVLVVASLDDDNPDVPAGAREQMLRFLEDVEAGVLE